MAISVNSVRDVADGAQAGQFEVGDRSAVTGLNLASHRKKVEWLRRNPQATFMLMNPANPYHWMSIKATVAREVHEDDPDEGSRATEQIDRMWTKYMGPGEYALRAPDRDERRILFEFTVDSVATFGRP